jgi:ribose 5-phosphate isomerase B
MPTSRSTGTKKRKRIGIASDHTGIELMQYLAGTLREAGYHVTAFGNHLLQNNDQEPDFIAPLAGAIAGGSMDSGIAICGGGQGVAAAANVFSGVRARPVDETFINQSVFEDKNLNLICLDGRVVSRAATWELVHNFLTRCFSQTRMPSQPT